MSSVKTERLLNLVICLLSTRRPLTKSQIRQAVPQYADNTSTEAFERMFERDKDELRELGIPLVTTSEDPLFEDEIGYRIDRDAYALPQITFEPDELAVLGLASRVWQQASLAGPATRALTKLTALGAPQDDGSLIGLEPRVRTAEPAFDALWAAVRDRVPVRFTYRTARTGEVAQRQVEPWGITSRSGKWYLTGHDRDRGAARVYRLSRVEGDVEPLGPAGSYDVPAGHEPRVMVGETVREARGAAPPRCAPAATPPSRCAVAPARVTARGRRLGRARGRVHRRGDARRGARRPRPGGGRRRARRPARVRRPAAARRSWGSRWARDERVGDRAAVSAAGDGAVAAVAPGRAAGAGGHRVRRVRAPAGEGPRAAVRVRPARPPARRPHRGRLGGRLRLPAQRRRHRPPAAARRRRGAGPDRRPAHAHERARSRRPRRRQPRPGQARGRRRLGRRARRRRPHRPRPQRRPRRARGLRGRRPPPPPAAPGVPRAAPRRDDPARRRPHARAARRRPLVPRGLVPPR